jgi:hypothetical protein
MTARIRTEILKKRIRIKRKIVTLIKMKTKTQRTKNNPNKKKDKKKKYKIKIIEDLKEDREDKEMMMWKDVKEKSIVTESAQMIVEKTEKAEKMTKKKILEIKTINMIEGDIMRTNPDNTKTKEDKITDKIESNIEEMTKGKIGEMTEDKIGKMTEDKIGEMTEEMKEESIEEMTGKMIEIGRTMFERTIVTETGDKIKKTKRKTLPITKEESNAAEEEQREELLSIIMMKVI